MTELTVNLDKIIMLPSNGLTSAGPRQPLDRKAIKFLSPFIASSGIVHLCKYLNPVILRH